MRRVLFSAFGAYNNGMKLEFDPGEFYRVKKGQGLREIALAFRVPPRVLAVFNGLETEPEEGQILRIPAGHVLCAPAHTL